MGFELKNAKKKDKSFKQNKKLHIITKSYTKLKQAAKKYKMLPKVTLRPKSFRSTNLWDGSNTSRTLCTLQIHTSLAADALRRRRQNLRQKCFKVSVDAMACPD